MEFADKNELVYFFVATMGQVTCQQLVSVVHSLWTTGAYCSRWETV